MSVRRCARCQVGLGDHACCSGPVFLFFFTRLALKLEELLFALQVVLTSSQTFVSALYPTAWNNSLTLKDFETAVKV